MDCHGNAIMSGDTLARCSDIAPAPVMPTTLPPSGPAGGELTGSYPNPNVDPDLLLGKTCSGANVHRGDTDFVKCADLTDAVNAGVAAANAHSDGADAAQAAEIASLASALAAKQGQLLNCAGTNHAAGARVPTCAEMQAAIAGAVPATPTSLPPSGPAGGDLAGTYPNPIVDGIRGVPVSPVAPTPGQVLTYNGSSAAWAAPPAAPIPATFSEAEGATGTHYLTPDVLGDALRDTAASPSQMQRDVVAAYAQVVGSGAITPFVHETGVVVDGSNRSPTLNGAPVNTGDIGSWTAPNAFTVTDAGFYIASLYEHAALSMGGSGTVMIDTAIQLGSVTIAQTGTGFVSMANNLGIYNTVTSSPVWLAAGQVISFFYAVHDQNGQAMTCAVDHQAHILRVR